MDRDKELRRAGWRLMGSAVRPQRGWVIAGVLAGAVWTAAKLAIPYFAAQAIDKGIIPGDSGTIVRSATLVPLAIAALAAVASVFASHPLMQAMLPPNSDARSTEIGVGVSETAAT